MKATWIKILIVSAAFATQSHAIFGIGGHWSPAMGVEVKADNGLLSSKLNDTVSLDEKGLTGLQGFGVKFWLDCIPLIDVEASGNMQFGYYDVNLVTATSSGKTSHGMAFDLNMPWLQAKPFFARAMGDVAVLYPFLKLPPLVSILKLYGGGGLSYGVATPILSASFAKDALTKENYNPAASTDAAIEPILVDAIKNASFEKGVGWFLQLGAHAKIPVIPIAVYADAKYRFPGMNPELVDGNGLNLELGGALAF